MVGIAVSPTTRATLAAGVEVAVDFTVSTPPAKPGVVRRSRLHAVVGTSGFGRRRCVGFDAVHSSEPPIAPNFAIGAVLMMRFAELAAPFFDTAEIIELHHDNKVDAPSGTAMRRPRSAWPTRHRTGRPTHDARRWSKGPAAARARPASRPLGPVPWAVAHQEVLLGTTGQTLTIRHDSYDG